MARLPTLSRDDLDPNGQELWDSLIASRGYVGGPTLCIMQHPDLAAKSTPLGSQLRYNGVLDGADRELTILTAGREVEAIYEWHAHEPIGLEVGVSKEAIEVLRNQQATTGLGEREAPSSTPFGRSTASTSSRTTCTPAPRSCSGARPGRDDRAGRRLRDDRVRAQRL